MNLTLFVVLFAFGFVTARIAGINFWMQLGYLTISALVGLNPQEPVAAQTIINTFLYLTFGIWIATAVGRLVWPVLPQYKFCAMTSSGCVAGSKRCSRDSPIHRRFKWN